MFTSNHHLQTFYNLNINKNDKVVLLEILKLKLSVASVEKMEYTLILRIVKQLTVL